MAHVISVDRFRALDLKIETKPDRTPVTDADRAVEQALRAALRESRPHDRILGEEYGGTREPGRQWILDPIDGTANFLRGVPVWGTLIALAVDGMPVVGVVSAPALGRRWWAARGEGAWTVDSPGADARRIRASGVQTLADASVSYNSLKGWMEWGRGPQLLSLAEQVWRTRGYGEFWSYMMVAEGTVDIAGEPEMQPYDNAALIPIVEEAGGRFSSFDGVAGPWEGTALATNGLLHDATVSAISVA
ncbi:inositol monophosphatase family protein [Naasia lichenicola]|uniref:Histidinol-phosphatase n=1 Tax=Naasia lichenicola TaxID=2565933 RepID=A0A4S4FI92_9MICO|nr:inositol monophosphatase family protein [Naasia lichenicola]THG28796.1 histidinol phosphatase [Naasia lichenicola]